MSNILACSGYVETKGDFVRAQGCYLYDSEDKQYVDFEAGIWCAALGHNPWRVNQLIKEQLKKVSHLGLRYSTNVEEAAAEKILNLLSLAGGKCVFLSSGSEAVEFGVQAMRKISAKPLFLTLADSYLSAYGSARQKRSDEWLVFDWQGCDKCKALASCDDCSLFKAIPFSDIGGFVFEPGNSGGLVKFPPLHLVKSLAERIKKDNGLILVDEVTTGLGRTGKWFGFAHYGIQPDIVALGKGLGNGYPVSAVAIAAPVADMIEDSSFHYAQSHQNDPMGCAIAKEVISILAADRLIERSEELGRKLVAQLETLKTRYPLFIKETRGRGLMVAVEFQDEVKLEAATAVYRELMEYGQLVGCRPNAGIIRFYPPLIIKEEDLDRLILNLDKILVTLTKGKPA